MKKITIDVSKKVEVPGQSKGVFKKVGEMIISVPPLAECVQYVASPIKKDEKGVDVEEDGLPVYEADEANWIQSAILAAVKAQARNKMVSGTATLKENLKIAETWAELCAEGVRGNQGLQLARDFKAAFAEWISKQGLSEAATATLITLVSNKQALQLQTPATKTKVQARLESFATALSADDLEKYQRPLEAGMLNCEATADALAEIE